MWHEAGLNQWISHSREFGFIYVLDLSVNALETLILISEDLTNFMYLLYLLEACWTFAVTIYKYKHNEDLDNETMTEKVLENHDNEWKNYVNETFND